MKAARLACVVFAASFLASCSLDGNWKPPPPTPLENNPPYSLSKADISTIQSTVSSFMKDPSSTQFRGVRAVSKSDGTIFVCGEINAKNSFGGYNGFAPFTGNLSGNRFHINIMPDQSADVQSVAFSSCHTAGIDLNAF